MCVASKLLATALLRNAKVYISMISQVQQQGMTSPADLDGMSCCVKGSTPIRHQVLWAAAHHQRPSRPGPLLLPMLLLGLWLSDHCLLFQAS